MSAKRWSSYDTDAYRLPSGMERVGYNDVTGRYTFRDSDGQEYTSASGSEYGKLEKGRLSLISCAQPISQWMADGRSCKFQPAGMAVLYFLAHRAPTVPRVRRAA